MFCDGPYELLGRQREGASRPASFSNRILLEQSCNHGRVKVGAYAYDHAVLEIHDPAVTVIEPHTVLGRGQRMKLHHRLIVFDDQVFHLELRSLWKDLSELVECARNECPLAVVVTR